mgnify:FL=1
MSNELAANSGAGLLVFFIVFYIFSQFSKRSFRALELTFAFLAAACFVFFSFFYTGDRNQIALGLKWGFFGAFMFSSVRIFKKNKKENNRMDQLK